MKQQKNIRIIESSGFKKLAGGDFNTMPGNMGRKDDPGMIPELLDNKTDSTSTKDIEKLWKKKSKKSRHSKPGRVKMDKEELPRSML